MKTSSISVVIPVKNDRRIAMTLNGLAHQKKVGDFEIIVVDSSRGSLDDIKNKYKDRVTWVNYVNDKNYKRTTVAQVNLGAKSSKTDLIAYIDADCVPDDTWLYNLTLPLIEEGEYFTAGMVRSLNGPTHQDEVWDKFSKDKYIGYCPNMNSAIRREILKHVGEYDELTFNYGWDMDFAWRAIDAGYKIRFVPNAIIYHDWGLAKYEIKRNYNYGIAKVRLYRKHPDRIRSIMAHDPLAVKYPLLILSLPIVLFFPLYLLVLAYFIHKDIKNGDPWVTIQSNLFYGYGVIVGVIELVQSYLKRSVSFWGKLPLQTSNNN